ncbi:dihydroneopterin aldolase [Aestuariispira ectoiniformans]|uniref:dihydroneopterin aldolase n=1 Tax=Aestuariispira ectoiniformans TaxID=2775080 RepID=UPI00223C37B7|nr:dihydroneopterin aldolase [Aestuariispira ectoiniformans]
MANDRKFVTNTRKILLSNYTLPFRIGIHDFELENKQRVSIDIELTLAENVTPAGDDISSTVDYDYLREEIKKLSDTADFNLQETLCEAIVGICFQNGNAQSAVVRTSKIDVYPDCDAVSFEISASRPS